ncbi:multimodular transpeptidase-transglycosylase [Halorhodospira halochloris]|uniref:Penicillin-binding protein 1A n=1 Tax=Halorhodospira halochloris TaxID=1052 RepID=A0A120MZG6_HALHR|nr:penicillin-binding protein 1A [Halorhodospira halochloris]MBK1650636.1 peptidase [Halorhodospira halochloris]BAU56878.1 multimodular transpeptidase-transglycosylase [Halorhodospira halochloris]
MNRLLRVLLVSAVGVVSVGFAIAVVMIAYAAFVLWPQLPSADSLREIRLQEPLRVVSAEGDLLAEYGEQRRQPKDFDEFPTDLVLAFIAAEDDRFFQHPGVDYQGMARAIAYVLREREFGPGGSTITMQVARNFFLSREQTILRKANEMLLALQIERTLTKEEILELYLNKIYMGNRAYGVAAAAEVYYGKSLDELDLAQMAMIAGLPKAPSAFNPIRNPQRALQRRAYVLARMYQEGFISHERYEQANAAPVTARLHAPRINVDGRYVAEMARQQMVDLYGEEEAYTGGFKVYTTVHSEYQQAANRSLRRALEDYDRRHGYRGPEGRVSEEQLNDPQILEQQLRAHPPFGGLIAGIVLEVEEDAAWVLVRDDDVLRVPFSSMEWAREYIDANRRGAAPESAKDVVSRGDIIRVARRGDDSGLFRAVPEAEGALVSLSPVDGRIFALSGGYDFRRSSYNRAVQANRQTGSAFKPFIYSAALEHGYTAASIVNDAPVVFQDDALEGYWRPGNYTGRFYGPTRLREALVFSRNLVSIRVLRDIGVGRAIEHVTRFGFDRGGLPADLSLALGSNSATPLQMARGFAVFANGGFLVEPNVIERVEDPSGDVVFAPNFPQACKLCDDGPRLLGHGMEEFDVLDLPPLAPRKIAEDNAWIIGDILADVMTRGTGRGALRLVNRGDMAGKTGTTNDLRDAWFVGYTPDMVTAAWAGFDDQRTLGARETGAAVALPMWSRYMATALERVEERSIARPEGLVTVRINPESGKVTGSDNPDAVFETFREDSVPVREEGDGRDGRGRGAEREIF